MTETSVWELLQAESRAAIAVDSSLAKRLAAAIFAHAGFGSALSGHIGRRLAKDDSEHLMLVELPHEAFGASPELVDRASRDLLEIARRDPASDGCLPVFLNFKGYIALQAWRVANWLWNRDRVDSALLIQSASSDSLQVSIHPSADIGSPVFIDHGTDLVIGASVRVGDGVTIMQNVTIGQKDRVTGRAPRIGKGVLLGTGSTILGDIEIGDLAKIGANAIVVADVPAGCTAVGNPAHLTNCPAETAEA